MSCSSGSECGGRFSGCGSVSNKGSGGGGSSSSTKADSKIFQFDLLGVAVASFPSSHIFKSVSFSTFS